DALPISNAFVSVAARPMISWTLDALAPARFARSVVAVPPGREAEFAAVIGGGVSTVAGGEARAACVRLAFRSLRALADDLVCVHDAARPLIRASEVESVLVEAERTGAAIAAAPIVDTVKQVDGDR